MSVSQTSCRTSVLLLSLLAFGTAGCAETVVQQQGSSRTVVRQTDGAAPTHSTVVRTPSSQKVITRTGNSTDVTIQSSDVPPVDPNARRSRTADAPSARRENCSPRQPDKKVPPSATGRGCDWSEYDTVDEMEAAAKKRIRPAPSIGDLEERAKNRIRSRALDEPAPSRDRPVRSE